MRFSAIKDIMQIKYGNKILLYQNSLNWESVTQWMQVLDNYRSAAELPSLNINYDVYAAGEAKLAWVDQVLEIFSSDNNAMQQAEDLVNKIYAEVNKQEYPIGHLKFLINNAVKLSFTSAMEPAVAIKIEPAASATVLINMRVQAAPEILTGLVANAIKETRLQSGCSITS